MDKRDLIDRLTRSSILSVFEAASKMYDLEDRMLGMDEMYEEPAYQEDLTLSDIDEDENWEGMRLCRGFDAFEEDPDDFLEGKEIGIPRNQLIVSSPIQGMMKPSPLFAALFQMPEEY